MLILQSCLLLLQVIDLVAIGIRLRDLCQVHQAEHTRQHNQHYGVTNGAELAVLPAKAYRVLVAPIIGASALAAYGQGT